MFNLRKLTQLVPYNVLRTFTLNQASYLTIVLIISRRYIIYIQATT
jgi:hypothetical protein